MYQMSAVVVLDIEGVLIDVSERIKRCIKEVNKKFRISARNINELKGEARRYFWEYFMSTRYLDLDKPILCNIELAKELQRQYKLILITGAFCNVAKVHKKKLERFGLKFTMFCRPIGNKLPASIFKREIIKKLVSKGYEIVMIFDDNEKVCRILSQYSRMTYLVKGCERRLVKRSELKFY